MRLYLYVTNGIPHAKTELATAQAAVEDHLRDRRDVSDVWWDEETPYIPRLYFYGASHSDYLADEDAEISWEQTDPYIFPVNVGAPAPLPPVFDNPDGVALTFRAVTTSGKAEMNRVIPLTDWEGFGGGSSLLLHMFAVEAAHHVNAALKKERS